MQTFMTPAERTPTVSRADPTDSARTPARTKAADPDGTPFDTVFHAASIRPGRVETTGPSGFRTVESRNAPENDSHTRTHDAAEDESRAVADTATAPPDPAVRPDVTKHARADNTTTPHVTETDLSAPQTPPDRDTMIDQTETDIQAMTMSDRAGFTRIDAAGPPRSGQADAHRFENPRATGAPDIEAQSLVAPASIKSDRAHGAPIIDPLRLAPVVEGRRSIRDPESAGWRVPMARGQDDARLSSPTGAPALASTASPAVMQGRAADALPSTNVVSAIFSDSAGGNGPDRGRDPDMPLGAEPRGTSLSNPGSATLATLPRSDLPQTIAMQIAAAIQKGGPGMKPGIELRLSPEELGTVRLTFIQTESGVTVNVHAERAETLELLRRNIDSLAQEFLDIGYQSAEFTFERRDTEAQSASQTVGTADPETAMGIAPEAPRAINPTLLISDRLDIRL